MKTHQSLFKWLSGLLIAVFFMASGFAHAVDYTVTLTPSAPVVSEGDGTVSFDVIIDPPADVAETLHFNVSFADGSALVTEDYLDTAVPSTVSFAPTESVQPFTVSMVNDVAVEQNENFDVIVTFDDGASTPDANVTNSPASATVTITDNDYTLNLATDAYGMIEMDGTLIADGSGGSAVTADVAVEDADTPTLSFSVLNSCFFIQDVQVNGGSEGPIGSYDFPPITADQTVHLMVGEYATNVTKEAYGNGTITPVTAGEGSCEQSTTSFEVTANEGYHIAWIRVDGAILEGYTDPYTVETYTVPPFNSDTNPHLIEAAFTNIVTITEMSPFGTIVPVDETCLASGPCPVEVGYEVSPSYEISVVAVDPADHPSHNGKWHTISDIIIDDVSIPGIKGGDLGYHLLDYFTSPNQIIADHTIEILFTSFVDVTITGPGTVSYTDESTVEQIVDSADGPDGSIEVEAHANALLMLTPGAGYHIEQVLLDGLNIGTGSQVNLADMVDEDHTLEVTYGLDTFVIEAVSTYDTIYMNASETTPATTQYPDYDGSVTFYVDLNDAVHAVEAVLIDNLPIEIPTPAEGVITDINGEWQIQNNNNNNLRVTFTGIVASHRLEAVDYDLSPIHDVPLAASSISAPPNLMLLFDDSGSMSWSVMTPNDSEGKYRIGNSYYENVFYGPDQIPSNYRMQWKSQWHQYNRVYYNPDVDYVPWPRVVVISEDIQNIDNSWESRTEANASTIAPRIHPLEDSQTLQLHAEFTRVGAADEIIIDDGWDGYYSCDQASRETGSGYANDYRELYGPRRSCGPPYARWRPTIADAGEYEVFVQWQGESDSYRNVCYTVEHEDGVDQACGYNHTSDSPGWVSLGTYDFIQQNYWWSRSGSTPVGSVTISGASNPANSTSEIQADAVMFRKVDSGAVSIPYAHYYVWSETADAPYLVIFNNSAQRLDYYEASGTNVDGDNDNSNDFITTLEQKNSGTDLTNVPEDVRTSSDYDTALQNFANWVTYYHERRLSAVAATSRALVLMDGAQVGLSALNSSTFQLPVQKIRVDGEDRTDDILRLLYRIPASGGTPLRRALDDVGEYYDMTDGGLYHSRIGGNAPWASAEDGGECQQSFALLMTDGYWNSDGAGPAAVREADNKYYTPAEAGNYLYRHPDTDTLADVAMYYYERDMVPDRTDGDGNTITCDTSVCLDDIVPTSPENTPSNDDPANWQHMVTFAVSFGLQGQIDQDYYLEPYQAGSSATRLHVDNPDREFPDWPYVGSNNIETVDDMFHAGVNGRGGFHNASNPDELVRAMVDIVSNISDRSGSAASVSVNGDELFETISDQTRMFQSEYNTDTWYGDLLSYGLDPITGDLLTSPVWSASEKMQTFLATPSLGHSARNIYTYTYTGLGGGSTFDWGSLSPLQQAYLDPYFVNNSILTGQNVLAYLRGDDTFEADNTFRDRLEPLGDFVHSRSTYENGVLYIGGNDGMLHAFYADDVNGGEELFAYIPSFVYKNLRELANPSYQHQYYVDSTPFVDTIYNSSGNPKTVLVGGLGKGGKGYYALDVTSPASFSATNVMWEFPEMPTIPAPKTTVSFHDMGNGNRDEIRDSGSGITGLSVGDYVDVIGADCSVAPAGSNSDTYEVLALRDDNTDGVSDVIEVAEGSLLDSCGNNNSIYLIPAVDPDIGYTYGIPIMVKTNDTSINSGDAYFEGTVVIFPNGYSSPTGNAVLYIVNPLDGSLIRKIDTGAGPFNGLSNAKVIDVDNNLRADYVYAGDLLGNIWKFDLTDASNTNWQVAFCDEVYTFNTQGCNATGAVPQPLFSTNANQPITGAPDIMFHSGDDGMMVIFGTGKYLSLTDLASTDTQTLYGIWDWAPDGFDAGYLGSRVDDTSVDPPIALLSHAPLRDAANDPVNTLLRQETWAEGYIDEDADNDGNLDVDEDVNGNGILDAGEDLDGDGRLDEVDEDTNGSGTLDTYSYYRIPSNYQGDWSMVQATFDVNHDGTHDELDRIPAVNVGWYYDLPGKILDNDNVDNDGDGNIDNTNEHGLGERVISDAIIRDGRAILISFGMTNSICSAGAYSFVNERDADNGGMTGMPVFDITGNGSVNPDGEVDASDMVYIKIDSDGDGVLDKYVPGIPTDKSFDGHLYNPAILRESQEDRPAEETKYFSATKTTGNDIVTLREAGERRGIYYWLQAE